MLPIPEAYRPPALNLGVNGKPLTYRSAKNGPDRLLWEHAESDELIRLLDSETIVPIRFSDIAPRKPPRGHSLLQPCGQAEAQR